jgi:hypothetical protein
MNGSRLAVGATPLHQEGHAMNVETRCKIEARIAKSIVKSGLAKGYAVSVNDGGEWVVKRSTDAKDIIAALFSTDADYIRFRTASGERVGTVFLVYGNDGWDVINDYTDTEAMRAVLTDANALADKLERQYA